MARLREPEPGDGLGRPVAGAFQAAVLAPSGRLAVVDESNGSRRHAFYRSQEAATRAVESFTDEPGFVVVDASFVELTEASLDMLLYGEAFVEESPDGSRRRVDPLEVDRTRVTERRYL